MLGDVNESLQDPTACTSADLRVLGRTTPTSPTLSPCRSSLRSTRGAGSSLSVSSLEILIYRANAGTRQYICFMSSTLTGLQVDLNTTSPTEWSLLLSPPTGISLGAGVRSVPISAHGSKKGRVGNCRVLHLHLIKYPGHFRLWQIVVSLFFFCLLYYWQEISSKWPLKS